MKNKVFFYLSIGFSLALISCASNKIAPSNQVFENDKEFISNTTVSELIIGKKYSKETLSTKSNHVFVSYSATTVPLNVYKLNLEKSTTYKLILKSIPEGLGGWVKDEKRTVMIPEITLYDENFNIIKNENIEKKAVAPTAFEPFLFRIITEWNISETGSYYLVVKADMSSNKGIELNLYNAYNSWLFKFRRVLYGKYKLVVSKK